MDTPRRLARCIVVCVGLTASILQPLCARADDTPMEFTDPTQEQSYLELLSELRCLVCQNQSLAESHADLAQDLREEIYARLRKGQSKQEIIGYLVARYGDFVRYQPPLKFNTLLLWFGPFLLLAAAALILIRVSHARRHSAALTIEEQGRVRALLGDREPD